MSPCFAANTASSNGLTIEPSRAKKPRSPPCAADPGSCEFFFASSANCAGAAGLTATEPGGEVEFEQTQGVVDAPELEGADVAEELHLADLRGRRRGRLVLKVEELDPVGFVGGRVVEEDGQ